MPKIHPSHIKGNEAVSGLVYELSKFGILAEQISNDYGEDLLLQTHIDGIADPFAIRVQVKYTALKKNKDGKYRFRFPTAHLQRWITHSDVVLLCLYDKASHLFLVVDPRRQFSMWDLATTHKKSMVVVLSDEDGIEDTSVKRIIWRSRINHYEALLARLEHNFLYEPLSKKDGIARSKRIKGEIGVLMTSFLKAIKVLGPRNFDHNFMAYVQNSARNLAKKASNEVGLRGAFMLSVMGRVNDSAGVGLPRNLMEHATELSGHYFRYLLPQKWKTLSMLYRTKWVPYRLGERKATKRGGPVYLNRISASLSGASAGGYAAKRSGSGLK